MTINVSSVAYVRHIDLVRDSQQSSANSLVHSHVGSRRNVPDSQRQANKIEAQAAGASKVAILPKQHLTDRSEAPNHTNTQGKAPSHRRRFKLSSVLRRLSFRNLMEYCVSALNEASSSCASNRFDLASCEEPIWFLGHEYKLPEELTAIRDDLLTRLWITYRRNFPPIDANSRYVTDRGFGCMIRCGQMVLANALVYNQLGKLWRWTPSGLKNNPIEYTQVLRLFQDKFSSKYSIHNIVHIGEEDGKPIGEWFGPNTIAQALKKLSRLSSGPNTETPRICIEVALDNVVIADDIRKNSKLKASCVRKQNNDSEISKEAITSRNENYWNPSLLFIPLRLGLSKINPIYFEALKKTFQFPQTLGIIGGRPNHALYLVGYIGNDIIYLDPHTTQPFVDLDAIHEQHPKMNMSTSSDNDGNRVVATLEEIYPSSDARRYDHSEPNDSTYHCDTPEKMPIDRLDPSLALCFYFHTEKDFDDWCQQSTEKLIETESQPMFEISQSRPSFWPKSPSKTPSKDRSAEVLRQSVECTKSVNTGHLEKFTVLSESRGEQRTDAKHKTGDADSDNPDDEEFEMLG